MDSAPLILLGLFLFLLFLGLVYIAIFEPSGGYGLQWEEDKTLLSGEQTGLNSEYLREEVITNGCSRYGINE